MTGGEGNDTFGFYYSNDDSTIDDLTRENISEDALGVTAANFGLPQLANLDSIIDLNLGGDGTGDVDGLWFQGWDDVGSDAGETHTISNVSANNMADLISAFENVVGFDDDDQAVLIHVNGGAFAGKSFLLVSTDDDGGGEDPEYALQVTGVTGTFDDGDING
jgi:hypothetical protein